MNYVFWANTTAVTHFIIIIAVILGLLISFRYRRFRPWEAFALLTIVVLWSYYGNCPLTILEERFHTLAGSPSGITNIGFLPYYANKLLNIQLSSRLVQRATFFTGGSIFAASIEWFQPYLHLHLFHFRKSLKKMFGLSQSRSKKRYA